MEENKNDIDELVKSIDSSFKEMSLKDIVSAHEDYFGAEDISFDDEAIEEKKPEEIKTEITEKPKTDMSETEVKTSDKLEEISESEKKAQAEEKDIENNRKDAGKNIKVKTREERLKSAGRIGNWFQTFCYMRIPVIGFIYILVIAFSKKVPESKREFAKGYILYKVLIWILAVVLLYCLYKVGLGFVDGMLSFIKA